MTGFDFVLLAILVASVVLGLIRGLVKEVLSLAAYGLAFLAAIWWGPVVNDRLEPWISQPFLRMGAAYVGVFVVVLLTIGLFNMTLTAMIRATGLTPADHGLGAVFGLLRGVLFVLLLVIVAGYTPLPHEPWWKNAMFSGRVVAAIQQIKLRVPPPVDQWLPY